MSRGAKKPVPKKRKKGRPSLYTEALAAKICRRLAEGETLRAICRDKAMPDKASLHRDQRRAIAETVEDAWEAEGA